MAWLPFTRAWRLARWPFSVRTYHIYKDSYGVQVRKPGRPDWHIVNDAFGLFTEACHQRWGSSFRNAEIFARDFTSWEKYEAHEEEMAAKYQRLQREFDLAEAAKRPYETKVIL